MNKMRGLALCALMLSGPSGAYEVDTHAWMTKRAFDRSSLSSGSPRSAELYRALGWDRLLESEPFNLPVGVSISGADQNSYYDLPGLWGPAILPVNPRAVNTFEQRRMPIEYQRATPPLGDRPWLRFEGWLMRGAIREDDLSQGEYLDGFSPDVDPHGEITRVLRHFYNPVNDDSIVQFARATDWSLGVTDALLVPPVVDAGRRNHFSWADGRRAFYQALTYKTPNPETSNLLIAKDDFSRRHIFWGTAVKSIGHVLHLLQDAAQPQHSRLDYHNHSNVFPADLFNESLRRRTFESFTNLRILEALGGSDLPFTPQSDERELVTLLGQPLNSGVGDPMPTGNYPVPSFTLPVEFFTTKGTPNSQIDRRGLADYSNRGFFSEGTLFNSTALPLPPSGIASPGNDVVEAVVPTTIGDVVVREIRRVVPDSVAPGYVDAGITPFAGKAPLFSVSMWDQFGDVNGDGPGRIITLHQYKIHADMLAPRAIAYGAGMIDYFFRGRLEITPNEQAVFAVLNQGTPHTVDSEGYPRKTSNSSILGFEKVRLKVRNITEAITEPGPGSTAMPQTSGNGTMVAVARYHRNACYRPDMSGERMRDYAPPPALGAITEPACTVGTPPRTNYQEISVSAPMAISSEADLPGGQGVGGPAIPKDVVFDFTDDPIPVNATDLFIQVVYRGQLGDEPDAVAVGTYDVREPTYVGIYNNTDYYWNGIVGSWIAQQPTFFPQKNVDFLRVCTGAGGNSRWAYYAQPVGGFPALGLPGPQPGAVRLAMIFAIPSFPTQQFSVRVTPVMDIGTSAPQISYITQGQQRQANKELIADAVLNDPQMCTPTPTAATYWCNEPIKRRRGRPFGEIAAPIYYTNGGSIPVADVDAPPLPAFPGLRMKEDGLIKYNDETLVNCPPAPTTPAAKALIELLETAAYEGIEVDG